MCVRGQIADTDWKLNFCVEFVARKYSSLHLGFVVLVVQPEFDNDHDLQIHVNVLDLVSFVARKVRFYFVPRNVVELANLI